GAVIVVRVVVLHDAVVTELVEVQAVAVHGVAGPVAISLVVLQDAVGGVPEHDPDRPADVGIQPTVVVRDAPFDDPTVKFTQGHAVSFLPAGAGVFENLDVADVEVLDRAGAVGGPGADPAVRVVVEGAVSDRGALVAAAAGIAFEHEAPVEAAGLHV